MNISPFFFFRHSSPPINLPMSGVNNAGKAFQVAADAPNNEIMSLQPFGPLVVNTLLEESCL